MLLETAQFSLKVSCKPGQIFLRLLSLAGSQIAGSVGVRGMGRKGQIFSCHNL